MRKTLCTLLALGLMTGVAVAPASAGKKSKKVHVHDSFSASLAPFPKLAAWGDVVGLTKPGCSAGEQDVHWAGVPLESPGKGTLEFYSEGFSGDWDLYVFDEAGTVIARSEATQINTTDPTAPAPAEERLEVPLTKGQNVLLVMCNWFGGPDNTAHYEGVFKT